MMTTLQYGIYSLSSIILGTSYYFQQKYIFLLTLCSTAFVIMIHGLLSFYQDKQFIEITNILCYLVLLNLTWNFVLSLINIYYKKDLTIQNHLTDDCVKDICDITKNLDSRTQRLLIRTINKHLVALPSDKNPSKNL